MSTTISRLSVIMSGDIGGLAHALNEGKGRITEFRESVETVHSGLEKMLGAVGIGLGLGEIASHLVEMVHGSMESIDASDRLAISLGVSTQAIERLNYAARITGVSQDSVSTGLRKMEKTLDDARNGLSTAVIAMKELGLSTQDFQGLAPDQSFIKLAGAINRTHDSAARMSATMAFFGRSGSELLPMIAEGSEGLGRMADSADRTGNALSAIDNAKVVEAGEAMREFQASIAGASNKLAVLLSPYLTVISEKLTAIVGDARAVDSSLHRGLGGAVVLTGELIQGFRLVSGAIRTFAGVAGLAIGAILIPFDLLIKAIDEVGSALHITGDGFHEFAAGFDAFQESVMQKSREQLAAAGKDFSQAMGGNGTDAGAAIAGMKRIQEEAEKTAKKMADEAARSRGQSFTGGALVSGTKQIDRVAAKLKEEQKAIDEFGKSAARKAAMEIAAIGGSAAQQRQAAAMANQLAHLKAIAKAHDDAAAAAKRSAEQQAEAARRADEAMADAARQIFESTRTPAEKYAEKLGEINKLLHAGKLDQETADRAIKAAKDQMNGAAPGGAKDHEAANGPTAAAKGSSEAANLIAAFQRGSMNDTPRKQLAAQTEGNKILHHIARGLARRPRHHLGVAKV